MRPILYPTQQTLKGWRAIHWYAFLFFSFLALNIVETFPEKYNSFTAFAKSFGITNEEQRASLDVQYEMDNDYFHARGQAAHYRQP